MSLNEMIRPISISSVRLAALPCLLLGVHLFVGCVNSVTESDIGGPASEWNTGVSLRKVDADVKKDGEFVITTSVLSRKGTGKRMLMYVHEKRPDLKGSVINVFDRSGELVFVIELDETQEHKGFRSIMVFDGSEDPVAAFGRDGNGILKPISKTDVSHLWPGLE